MADPAASATAACLNCGEPFAVPRPKFCPACGQETSLRPPTLGEFAQQFGGAYFSTEGALWRTLALLLFKPGELTRRYLTGRRKHYVLPLRLYLSVSVVFLVALRLSVVVAPPPDLSKIDDVRARPRTLSVNLGIGRADVKDGVFTCQGLPQWLCGRLRERMVLDPKAVAEELRLVRERFTANWGAMMFALMPSFAFGLWLLYRNRRMRYTEHLVFALHLHAFWFIAITVLAIDFAPTETFALIAIPVYGLLALRRVYGGGWMPLLLRAAVLSIAYSTLAGLAIATLALVALLA